MQLTCSPHSLSGQQVRKVRKSSNFADFSRRRRHRGNFANFVIVGRCTVADDQITSFYVSRNHHRFLILFQSLDGEFHSLFVATANLLRS